MKRTSVFILLLCAFFSFEISAQTTLRLNSGQRLDKGQKVEVAGKGFLTMQTDGNLVAYTATNQPKWASGTYGKAVTHVVMQTDGNLVIYNGTAPVWSSNTWNAGANYGYFQINLNTWQIGIYSASNALVKELNPGTTPPPPTNSGPLMGDADMCWAESYGRGAGTIPNGCPAGMALENGLCYTPCQAGYKGEGPVCWQSCPADYTDIGTSCSKPAAYGRGSGYPWKFGDALNLDAARARCERDNPGGCEKYGEMYYPKCKAGYAAFGCCVCSPNCPAGMTDAGATCIKKSYGRGAGLIPTGCPAGQNNEVGLCYKACTAGYQGVGPVCWANCPSVFPYKCAMGCTKDANGCATVIVSQVSSTLEMVASITGLVVTAGTASAGKTVAKTSIKASIQSAAKAVGKDLAESTLENAASMFYDAQLTGEFSWEDLDPTGIANVVKAFNKPLCKDVK